MSHAWFQLSNFSFSAIFRLLWLEFLLGLASASESKSSTRWSTFSLWPPPKIINSLVFLSLHIAVRLSPACAKLARICLRLALAGISCSCSKLMLASIPSISASISVLTSLVTSIWLAISFASWVSALFSSLSDSWLDPASDLFCSTQNSLLSSSYSEEHDVCTSALFSLSWSEPSLWSVDLVGE